MVVCCGVSIHLEKTSLPNQTPAYQISLKNHLHKAIAPGTRIRVQAQDPTVTAIRTILFENDGNTVDNVCVLKGVLTFALLQEIAPCALVNIVLSVETVNVSARASVNVTLNAFIDSYELKCPVKKDHHFNGDCFPIASLPLVGAVDVLDDCALTQVPLLTTGNRYFVKPSGPEGVGCPGIPHLWEQVVWEVR